MGSISSELRAILFKLFGKDASLSARLWWESTRDIAPVLSAEGEFGRMYARTARTLGAAPIDLSNDEWGTIPRDERPLLCGRPLHEFGRMVLLMQAVDVLTPELCGEFIRDLYERGDLAERQALLRTLPLLPDPGSFLSTAVEACRSNVQTVFEAIACENPYPSRHFPELSFNQLVMKALFFGVSLQRIVGLLTRVGPDLVRMVGDYVQEQTTAGRPVPDDVYGIMGNG